MDKEVLYQRLKSMIMSTTKDPKYMSFSTEKVGELLNTRSTEVEQGIQELVNEGRLRKSKLNDPPHTDIYFLAEDRMQEANS